MDPGKCAKVEKETQDIAISAAANINSQPALRIPMGSPFLLDPPLESPRTFLSYVFPCTELCAAFGAWALIGTHMTLPWIGVAHKSLMAQSCPSVALGMLSASAGYHKSAVV